MGGLTTFASLIAVVEFLFVVVLIVVGVLLLAVVVVTVASDEALELEKSCLCTLDASNR